MQVTSGKGNTIHVLNFVTSPRPYPHRLIQVTQPTLFSVTTVSILNFHFGIFAHKKTFVKDCFSFSSFLISFFFLINVEDFLTHLFLLTSGTSEISFSSIPMSFIAASLFSAADLCWMGADRASTKSGK